MENNFKNLINSLSDSFSKNESYLLTPEEIKVILDYININATVLEKVATVFNNIGDSLNNFI